MIDLRDVTFTYPGGVTSVLTDFTVTVHSGEFCAVLGGNGSGKTSFCRTLTGLIPHFYRGRFSGTATVAGHDVATSGVATLARHVGYVYQDFENQLIRPRVIDDAAFAPLNFGFADYQERGRRALELLGIESLAERIIWELSGGERHLVAIAGALALDPEVLVIDEPVSQLDPVHARVVYEKLAELNRGSGKTILVVEHFTEFVGEFASSVVLLADGAVKWKLPPEDALSRVDELLAADLAPPPVTRLCHRIGMAPPLPISVDAALPALRDYARDTPTDTRRSQIVGLDLDDPDADLLDDMSGARAAAVDRGETLVELRRFGHSYLTLSGDRRSVIANVDLRIGGGERVALVGANGSGKSTLLSLMAGLRRAQEGEVFILGHETSRIGAEHLSDWVALVYQQPHEMFIEDSVRGDIGYFMTQRGNPDSAALVAELLREFDLEALADRDGRLLSGGQMRRASLAIAAGMRPRLLLLDEPTSSLDVVNRRLIVRMLRRLDRWVSTTIVATHDMELVARWADRVVVLNERSVAGDLPTRDFFARTDLLRRCRIREPQVVALSRLLQSPRAALSVAELAATLVADQRGVDGWKLSANA